MTEVTKPKLSFNRKVIFSILMVFIPIFFLFLIEILLRLFSYGDNYDLFEDQEFYGQTYRICNPDYGKKYFNFLPYTSPNLDIFLKDKPDNSFRIFVLGSSTAYGFPYQPGIMFSRILQERLQNSFPEKKIEVVNTAITAINSFTFQDKIDDILGEEPDALLIYAGHNEFYGGMGIGSKDAFGKVRWIKLLHLQFMELKIYQLMRSWIFGISNSIAGKNSEQTPETATLMERSVANFGIEYKSNTYERAQAHYEKNMSSVLRKANKKKVPVFYSEVICNIKDLKPFASIESDDYPPAIEVYNEAIEYENRGEHKEAKDLFYKAKDLDGIRFRASEEINDIINDLAIHNDAYLVKMKSIFEKNSPNGLIGDNLLTEHVHPNIDGYFLMADAFYNALIKSSIIGQPDTSDNRSSEWYRKNWGFTSLDSLSASLFIRKLKGGWPFQPDTIINSFIRTYKPISFIDSLAYQAVRYDDISLESAHKTLAKYYLTHEQPEKAVKEYASILKSDPYKLTNYIEAGDILFDEKNYEKALDYYLQALKLYRDNYVLSRIGETYSFLGKFDLAITFLEEVHKKSPEFRKNTVVEFLYNGYNQTGNTDKANALLAQNQEIFNKKASDNTKQEIVLRIPAEVKNQIEQAISLLQRGEINLAYNLLIEANQITETNVANRFLGDILLMKKDKRALFYLKKVYYDYKTDLEYLNTVCYASVFFRDYQYASKILPELKQLDPTNPNIPKYEKALASVK